MIELKNIVKSYGSGGEVLRGLDLHLDNGDFLSVSGGSGSGKTTLLNIVGCLDSRWEGSYALDGQEVRGLSPSGLGRLRNEKIGFIFQSYNLIPSMTAMENVMLPLMVRRESSASRRKTAEEALAAVGLGDKLSSLPRQLSGGQKQRVAVARVIACRTPVVLADEPTGSLDPRSGAEVMDIIGDLNRSGVTVLLITHDPKVAAYAKRRAVMKKGVLISDG